MARALCTNRCHGLIGGLSSTVAGLGPLVGLIGGVIGAVLRLQPVERAGFRWTDVFPRMGAALRDGLRVGLSAGLIFGLIRISV